MPIPYELLVDLAEGRIDPPEADLLRARVCADPVARAELTALEDLIQLMRTDDQVNAPAHVLQRALRLVRPPVAAPATSPLQQLIARLAIDSWQTSALASGVRTSRPWPRTLLFNVGDCDLDLQIVPHGDGWQLSGQVLGPEESGMVMLRNPATQVPAPMNELGEFVLPAVRAGHYDLVITLGAREIVVPDLELGP